MKYNILIDDVVQQAVFYPIFVKTGSVKELRHLVICASGTVWFRDKSYELEELSALISSGDIVAHLNEGDWLIVSDLASVRITKAYFAIRESEIIKELKDVVNELNGRETTSDICRTRYNEYLASPTNENCQKLKQAYEEVPHQLRVWLLSFDEKDAPIRRAIARLNEADETSPDS